MTELIEKYLGEKKEEIDEAHGRGMLRLMHTRNPKKLAKLLKKANIPFSELKGKIYVGDDDEDEVEMIMARNLLF